jgi:hypothetical protein
MTKSVCSETEKPKPKPRMYNETDWTETPLFDLVRKLMKLDDKNKLAESKVLLEDFLNPNNLDIFTEEEASYYCSFLRRQAIT